MFLINKQNEKSSLSNQSYVYFLDNKWINFWIFVCTRLFLSGLFVDLIFLLAFIYCCAIYSNSNLSQSGIPMSIVPFLGTIKKLHGNFVLCLIITLHMPNCEIEKLLYVYTATFLFMYLFNLTVGVCWNKVLNMLTGIRFPLLSVSIL